MSREVNRRQFIAATTSAGVGLALTATTQAAEKPAALGGKPVRTKGYGSWPMVDADDEKAVLEVVRAGRWYRNRSVQQFEKTYAELNQAKSKLRSRVVLSAERPRGRLFAVGSDWVQRQEYRNVRQDLDDVAAITLEEVAAVLSKYPLTRSTTITIGPLAEVSPPA